MCGRTLFTVCAVSPYCRNVLPLGGASERSSAGPSTHSFTMGGTTSGNLSILVMTLIMCLENFLRPHNTHQRSSRSLRMRLHPLTPPTSPFFSYVSNHFYQYLILNLQQTDTRCVPNCILTVWCTNLDLGSVSQIMHCHFWNYQKRQQFFFSLIASYLIAVLKILV